MLSWRGLNLALWLPRHLQGKLPDDMLAEREEDEAALAVTGANRAPRSSTLSEHYMGAVSNTPVNPSPMAPMPAQGIAGSVNVGNGEQLRFRVAAASEGLEEAPRWDSTPRTGIATAVQGDGGAAKAAAGQGGAPSQGAAVPADARPTLAPTPVPPDEPPHHR